MPRPTNELKDKAEGFDRVAEAVSSLGDHPNNREVRDFVRTIRSIAGEEVVPREVVEPESEIEPESDEIESAEITDGEIGPDESSIKDEPAMADAETEEI